MSDSNGGILLAFSAMLLAVSLMLNYYGDNKLKERVLIIETELNLMKTMGDKK